MGDLCTARRKVVNFFSAGGFATSAKISAGAHQPVNQPPMRFTSPQSAHSHIQSCILCCQLLDPLTFRCFLTIGDLYVITRTSNWCTSWPINWPGHSTDLFTRCSDAFHGVFKPCSLPTRISLTSRDLVRVIVKVRVQNHGVHAWVGTHKTFVVGA